MNKVKSELNENLLDAIRANVDCDYNDNQGGPRNYYNTSADECEIICLEEQIKLLDKIQYEIYEKFGPAASDIIGDRINRLQNQIETITAAI